jgi:hypothetical protein
MVPASPGPAVILDVGSHVRAHVPDFRRLRRGLGSRRPLKPVLQLVLRIVTGTAIATRDSGGTRG